MLGILPSVASTLSYSLGYSGTAGLTWGWIIAFVGIQCVANSMAELSSSMPTSGGLFYCVGVLAPPKWAPFLAYITGWSNWLGLVSGSPSVNYGACAGVACGSMFTIFGIVLIISHRLSSDELNLNNRLRVQVTLQWYAGKLTPLNDASES